MSKLYNTQQDFTSTFTKFLEKSIPDIRKTQLNILPKIIFGMISSESCVPSDIAKVLDDDPYYNVQFDSVIKRIRRFFSNVLFKPYDFYKSLITYVLKDFHSKHPDENVFITSLHVFSKRNYTILMFTMRIGTFGIPIWFKCFKDYSDNEAFKLKTMKEGIRDVSSLFEDLDVNLIFLADRWFGSPKILEIINSLGHIYCVRLKGSLVAYIDNKKIKVKKLKHHKYHSVTHKDVLITESRFKTTIVYSSTYNTKDPWIIATNGDPKKAIRNYSYRFGSIETMFKAQKSNGFNLEKISNANLKSFTTMYTCVCTSILYLTILGADYTKNSKCYKNVKIETHKTYIINGKRVKKRIMSLFNVGLTLFKRAINSIYYIRIPVSFKLYDI